MAASSTRSKTHVYLLDSTITELTGTKLPSLRMALGLFLHHHTEMNATVNESSAATIKEIMKFWQKARIPVQDPRNSKKKLEIFFEEWRLLKKNKGRQTATQKGKEENFTSKLNNLFDIAHANAMSTIKIAEDKDFLLAQRESGRRGSMIGVDKVLQKKEKKVAERKMLEIKRCQRIAKFQEEAKVPIELASSDEDLTDNGSEDIEKITFLEEEAIGSPQRKRGRMNVMTPKLAAALDRTKVSDRKAVFIVAETAKSLGYNMNEININRSSIRRQRIQIRSKTFEKLKKEFQGHDSTLTVHWDGKLLQDLTGKEKVDRLPVIVTGKDISKLLIVAKLPSATGDAQAVAVYEALQEWGLKDKVCAMCFDTTNSNTGRINGTCTLLEKKLDKKLLALACRHHIMELIIGTVFSSCLGVSSAPDVPLFKRFQAHWEFIDKENYMTGINNDHVSSLVQNIKDDILEFAGQQLKMENMQRRADYCEFLELIIIFLGSTPARGIRFKAPGAMHNARWMSKVLYSLKIWMFRSEFAITPREERGLQSVCIFAARVYLKAWITAPVAQNAPYNDFQLMQSLLLYSSIDRKISKAASEKLAKHSWYLSEDLVGLAFFDPRVPHYTKRAMLKAMKEVKVRQESVKCTKINLNTFMNKKLEDFVTQKSLLLFEQMRLPNGFLQKDPEIWEDQEDYHQALKIVQAVNVVNDHAERGVALIEEFSGKLTQNESQLQFLLQVVEEHRRLYPNCKKQNLAGTGPSMVV